ncbi:MAG: HAMP domain-containing histidine kinase [Chitinophagaceae bacterium]|nr:HAMP domain-containing histidine kinase [Chitinophagaceae bacterium]
MIQKYLNWKTTLVLIAVVIAATAMFFANRLTKKLAYEERKKVDVIQQALEMAVKQNEENLILASTIISSNETIPLINTDSKDSIINIINIDTLVSNNQKDREQHLIRVLAELKKMHPPIEISISDTEKQFIYYGESQLLKQLRYFPYLLLFILFLFLLIVATFINTSGRQIRDKVWVGMSKETAHQLGTPLTSLVAWLEYLKTTNIEKPALEEMQKDVFRLQLIADRFSKIGSVPQLEEEILQNRLKEIISYMQRRASKNVQFEIHSNKPEVLVVICGPLFDWVIENLIRNALDAMDGKGKISLQIRDEITQTVIDITDTGKGISPKNVKRVFNPGFSTKKRGWGLGLSLAKRIISEYHYGDIFVKKSELGKGTTFRIILKR